MEYLIVDGYNIIHNKSWSDKFDTKNSSLEECRDNLLKILSNYQGYKNAKILVIFDAYNTKSNKDSFFDYDNIKVVYTKENETADNFIERFIYDSDGDKVIRVVTSDYLEQTMILRLGGIRMTPEELKSEVKNACKKARNYSAEKVYERNTIMKNVDKKIFELLDKMRRNKSK